MSEATNRKRMKITLNLRMGLALMIIPGFFHVTHAQLSPGDLTEVHAHLEGISNCTKCHSLGNKVTNEKCLDCHTEISARLKENAGYHASKDVAGKACVSCHSDHHGRNFEIIRFDKDQFNHNLTGYKLEGAHAKAACTDCHKPANIRDAGIRKKKYTYLGLNRQCTPCHEDYHQSTLGTSCDKCHGMEAFKPAGKFSHDKANFVLTGQHKEVACERCHPVTSRNDKQFRQFTGIPFKECSSCHEDSHQGRFGPSCSDCHTTTSFFAVKGMEHFDHARTGFPLENQHAKLACSSCHKKRFTTPLKHEKCTDCHEDYHEGEFVREGEVRSCADCHTTKGFKQARFTIDQHNAGSFVLKGSHLATPCFECHKTNDKWRFRSIGTRCSECHQDVHYPEISENFYPDAACESCHNEEMWNDITFDHDKTVFPLTGKHKNQSCRSCHFQGEDPSSMVQKFSSLDSTCIACHDDQHFGQFQVDGITACSRCHITEEWKIDPFDHDQKTAFKLEGKHAEIPCSDCHKPITKNEQTYILYKLGGTQCENCH